MSLNIVPDDSTIPRFGEWTPGEIMKMQRAERVREFHGWYKRFGDLLNSSDPKARAAVLESNRGLVQMRDVVGGAPHVDATLANLSIRFMNEDYIGTQLMPIAQVAKQSDKYAVFSDRDYLNYPDTAVGPRGERAQLSTNIDQSNAYFCKEHAAEEYVDMSNIANADAPLDLLANATYKCNNALEWNREKEIATILTATGSFGSNYATLAAGSEWDSAGGGTPVKNIQDAVGNCLGGPGPTELVGYCGYNVYKVLARHPEVRDLYKYTGSGLASPQLLAGTFGMDRLLVGKAWQDTANSGQTIALDRIWGEVFGVLRVSRSPRPNMYSFGMTFDWEGKKTEVFFDRTRGRAGGYRPMVGAAWVPKVVAARAGYLLTNCLA